VNNIYSVTHSIPKQTASYVIYQTAMDQTVHTSLVQEKEMPTSQQQNFMSVQAAETETALVLHLPPISTVPLHFTFAQQPSETLDH
jgi:hypothetical protein